MKKILKAALMLLLLGTLVSCSGSSISENSYYTIKGIVKSVTKTSIEITVYDTENAEGPYWIRFDDGTLFVNALNEKISLSDIVEGDKLEVSYNGQVMLSYPPQVFGIKIRRL